MNKVDAIGGVFSEDIFTDSTDTYLGLWLPEAGMKKIKELR